MSLSGNVDLLAGRIADEFNAVRGELSDKVDTLPIAAATLTGAQNILGINATNLGGVNVRLEVDGSVQAPTNGHNHQVIQLAFYAAGGDRNLTFNSGYQRLDGVPDTILVPTGRYLRVGIRKLEPAAGVFPAVWVIEAAAVTQ